MTVDRHTWEALGAGPNDERFKALPEHVKSLAKPMGTSNIAYGIEDRAHNIALIDPLSASSPVISVDQAGDGSTEL